jgi:DNA invertase Pin-like site-specific DNA recombinase
MRRSRAAHGCGKKERIPEEVKSAIRSARANGLTLTQIVERFDVGLSTAWRIVNPGSPKGAPSNIERLAQ